MKLYTSGKCPNCNGKGKIRTVLPESLRAIRNKKGLTLEQFGKRIGISKMYASDLETGRRRVTDRILKAYLALAKCKPSH